ncbi:hypothetical protein KC343_g10670 [Hortaea werneckii]|nr:hypothetical protein KC352_g18155 [Hortaea werneckii]KAI7608946.1 hypothetical protein KC346_g9400 [Hortaea werneckii]KAI7613987.1 hypothetical protein KC343_g10670 [Hortaea werneckii]KAI7677774.1 hypothetical protein KC319_g3714 [Hortaea werneckii]
MRTNSQGSVISFEDAMAVQKDHKAAGEEAGSHPIVEDPAAEVEAAGKLTPPVVFLPEANHHDESIAPDDDISPTEDPEATPKPQHMLDSDPDPTPKASTSPSHRD